MNKKRGYRDLLAWQRAYELSLRIYKSTASWPREEQYGLTSQIRRATVSVAANIAEGYDRSSRNEYIHFLSIARGSLAEVETFILLARDLGYMPPDDAMALIELQNEAAKLLRGLARSVQSKR